MTPFLKQIAKRVAALPNVESFTFIFPNRRAPLFFRDYLLDFLKRPLPSPKMVSIEAFFTDLSRYVEPDRLTLLYKLYTVYTHITKVKEPFYRFYFWGDMLLRDFDDIDKQLVDASHLFRNLNELKKMDASFDFMDEDQKEALKNFWKNINADPLSSGKQQFLKIWTYLPTIYSHYVSTLQQEGLGYEGMIYREVSEKLIRGDSLPYEIDASRLIFIGFNALAKSEMAMIRHYVKQGARIYWDTDSYYMDNPAQEAGHFLRTYQRDPLFTKTFDPVPSTIQKKEISIDLIGVSGHVGQARMVGQLLDEHIALGASSEHTAIVLPDENMLMPILYALPASTPDVNVTMGYPLQNASIYALLDNIITLQEQRRGTYYSHRQVISILTHPYVIDQDTDNVHDFCKTIIHQNRLYLSFSELQEKIPWGKVLFRPTKSTEATNYLLEVIELVNQSLSDRQDLDQEQHVRFYQLFSCLRETLTEEEIGTSWELFRQFFRQMSSLEKVPFEGKSLKGVQIMGMLETRNLDFENVYLLSFNEGSLPPSTKPGSYLPYRIRKAYELPTHTHRDASYAYLFYRLLQQSKRVCLVYNTKSDWGVGEMSRYARQLLYESGLPINFRLAHHTITLPSSSPPTISYTKNVQSLLARYVEKKTHPFETKILSPSAINDYIDCSLRFYFKHLIRLREPDIVEEESNARVIGNVLHQAIYKFYKTLSSQGQNNTIQKKTLEHVDELLNASVDEAFKDRYRMDTQGHNMLYQGQRIVAREMVVEWMKKILEKDNLYAPFVIQGLEEKIAFSFQVGSQSLVLGGIVDRIDRKDEIFRIIDYKTGADDLSVSDIPSLFNRDATRNKAAFQTFFYSYIYSKVKKTEGLRLMPGLINRKNLFNENFSFGHTQKNSGKESIIYDVKPYLEEFERHLKKMLLELYESTSFTPTPRLKTCSMCSYKSLCDR